MQLKNNRMWTLVGLALAASALAYVIGFPLAALGVLAGTPVGLVNFQLMNSVRQRMGSDESGESYGLLVMQRTLFRLLLSAGAIFAAALVGMEFVVGVLVGVVLEVLTYLGDALKMLFIRKG